MKIKFVKKDYGGDIVVMNSFSIITKKINSVEDANKFIDVLNEAAVDIARLMCLDEEVQNGNK